VRWLARGRNNDAYAIGYYGPSDLPFLGAAAQAWTTFDRYFSSIMAETFPNRFYRHSGVTDRLDNAQTLSTLPTIWDRLAERGLEGRYYFSDIPFLGLWGNKYLPIMRFYSQFLVDCATGDLRHVAFVDPRFVGEIEGVSNDDHPHADIRAGEWFMNQTYRAITQSPAWRHTRCSTTNLSPSVRLVGGCVHGHARHGVWWNLSAWCQGRNSELAVDGRVMAIACNLHTNCSCLSPR
jgi:phospholipase C